MRWTGIAVAAIAGTVDVLYLGYVNSQQASAPWFLRVPFVAGFIVLMAICAALSAWASAIRWRPLLLGASAGGLLLLGFFAMFSIGLPLVAAGLVALAGLMGTLSQTDPAARMSSALARVGMAAVGAVMAVVILLAGFTLTEFAIRCPVSGTEGGGGGPVLGSYQYSCDNGKLTISR